MNTMRELTAAEIELVSGAGFIETVKESTSTGGMVGTVAGYVVTNTVAGATRGGLIGAALGFAWGAGYGFGTAMYETMCG